MKMTEHELELAKRQAARYLERRVQPKPEPQDRRCYRCGHLQAPEEFYESNSNICKTCKKKQTAKQKRDAKKGKVESK